LRRSVFLQYFLFMRNFVTASWGRVMAHFGRAVLMVGLAVFMSGMAHAAGTDKKQPDLGELLLSKDSNPMVTFALAMSDACPVDFVGLARDAGEALGIMDPLAAAAGGGAFGDQVQGLHAEHRAQQSFLDKALNRFCLYSKLFGDGSCQRGN